MYLKYPGIIASSQFGAAPPSEVTVGAVTGPAPFNAADWTFQHSALAADDNMVLVPFMIRRNSAITTVTYAGIAASGLQELLFDLATDIRVYWAWWLAAILPAAGANKQVVISTGGTVNRGAAAAIALKGAAQSTPGFATGTATAASVSVGSALTAAGGSFIGSVIMNNNGADITPGGGSGSWNAVVDALESNNTDWCYIGYLLNQSGSITPSGSWTGSTDAAIHGIRVDPA